MDPQSLPEDGLSNKDRILAAAEDLIASSGVEAATTRAVAIAAGVQVPTIYRLFGDKDGLLDAVAERTMASYVAQKSQRQPNPDPLVDLRAGWDMHVDFGLANPGIFMVMALRSGPASSANMRGLDILRAKIRNLATAGRLRLPEDRALNLVRASATGTILNLLQQDTVFRDMQISVEAREAVIAALTGEAAEGVASGAGGAATALRTQLPGIEGLSDGERLFLTELLDRIAAEPTATARR